jgi:sister chromatid cohesion protein DCC1
MEETQHTLMFSEDFSPGGILLIELEESFLQMIENGETALYFVGCSKTKEEEVTCFRSDEAYLCTEKKSFKVVFRESSNSILPVETSPLDTASGFSVIQSGVVPVISLLHGNLELVPTSPRMDILRHLINEYESANNLIGLTFQQILDRVQISKLELNEELKRMHIVPLEEGCLRIVTCTELDQILDEIVSTGTLQNWDMPRCLPPSNEIIKHCRDYPPILVQHCLDFFCIPRRDNTYLTLDEYSVCRFKAKIVLSCNEENLPLEWNAFETKWQNVVPDFFQPRMEMLSGLAIIEQVGSKILVHALLEERLPQDIESRVKLLFQKKSNWTLEELEPYLLPVVPDVMKIEHILRKHCRPLKTIHSLGGGMKFSVRP